MQTKLVPMQLYATRVGKAQSDVNRYGLSDLYDEDELEV